MKLYEIFEGWMGYTAPQSKWDAMSVLRDILGADKVADSDECETGMYCVSRPWVAGMASGMFSDMDSEPGEGGAIGLPDPDGHTARDIAAAAHEGSHAWLHMTGKDHTDEARVNKMAESWLRKHLSGVFLHQALEYILGSKIHYGHN